MMALIWLILIQCSRLGLLKQAILAIFSWGCTLTTCKEGWYLHYPLQMTIITLGGGSSHEDRLMTHLSIEIISEGGPWQYLDLCFFLKGVCVQKDWLDCIVHHCHACPLLPPGTTFCTTSSEWMEFEKTKWVEIARSLKICNTFRKW